MIVGHIQNDTVTNKAAISKRCFWAESLSLQGVGSHLQMSEWLYGFSLKYFPSQRIWTVRHWGRIYKVCFAHQHFQAYSIIQAHQVKTNTQNRLSLQMDTNHIQHTETRTEHLTYGVALFMDHTGQILHDLTDVQHVSLWRKTQPILIIQYHSSTYCLSDCVRLSDWLRTPSRYRETQILTW